MDNPCDVAELPLAAVIDAVEHQLEAAKLLRYARPRLRSHLRDCARCRTVLVWSVLQLLRQQDTDSSSSDVTRPG